MAEENKKQEEESKQEDIAASLWEQVNYTFIDYVQFTSTDLELRILLGDRVPPKGKVRPLFGLVLTPIHAMSVLDAFSRSIERWKENIAKKQAALESKTPSEEPKE